MALYRGRSTETYISLVPISSDILVCVVDMKQHQLSDAVTCLHVQGIISSDTSPSLYISPKDTGDPFVNLLTEFLALTQVCSLDTAVKHDVSHHIETTSPPVSAHPRCLPPECLQMAKREFEYMLQLRIVCPAWSSHGPQKDW